MKLADYVITFLRDAGIKKVFVVYGSAIGDLVDAFTRVEGIDYICPFHEQAGAFMAEGYAKVSGEMGCAMATSGPGGINLLNGVANCFYDSVPCLFITGQVNSKFLKPNSSMRQLGFQENDIMAMAKPITKLAVMITEPLKIKRILGEAIHIATESRPGPVLIDIPLDIQKADIDPDTLVGFYVPKPFPEYNDEYGDGLVRKQIIGFIEDYKKSQRPVMLVGGGIWSADCVREARELGERLRVPCIPTWNAIDAITSDYELYAGRIGTFGGDGRNFAIQNCDLLLCIGTRISGRITGGNPASFAPKAKKYIVDIDKYNLMPEYQQVQGDVNIYCNAKWFCQMMLEELGRE